MIFWNRLMSLLPTFIMFGVLLFTYSIYFITNLKPYFNGFTYEIIIIHFLILIFLISLFRSMFQLPGIIPKELIDETLENWQRVEREEKEKLIEQLQRKSQRSDIRFKAETEQDKSVVNLDFEEIVVDEENKRKTDINQNTVSKRFCKKCCIPKPPRAHHCSACNTCWLKMDHHCLWINNCVAKDNYKMFFCMVFYASCLLIWVTISQYKIFQTLITNYVSDFQLYIIVLHFYFVFLLAVLISGFFIFHLYLISQNKTTLEQLENKSDKKKYNQGIWFNFSSVLGSNVFFWLIPS